MDNCITCTEICANSRPSYRENGYSDTYPTCRIRFKLSEPPKDACFRIFSPSMDDYTTPTFFVPFLCVFCIWRKSIRFDYNRTVFTSNCTVISELHSNNENSNCSVFAPNLSENRNNTFSERMLKSEKHLEISKILITFASLKF